MTSTQAKQQAGAPSSATPPSGSPADPPAANENAEAAPARVLCVDDEADVLLGLRMGLEGLFQVETFTEPEKAIEQLNEICPDVIISDMRMPRMNGAAFLAMARQICPSATRILLTGYAETDAALAAVNQGGIYRYLVKPCPAADLRAAVQAGAAMSQRANAERRLLQETLGGVLGVLSEVLALSHPFAFQQTQLLTAYIGHMSQTLGLREGWLYETAARLYPVGCVSLPRETLEKATLGQPLSDEELLLLGGHPKVGADLLGRIPRLEDVAAIIARQQPPELLPLASSPGGVGITPADDPSSDTTNSTAWPAHPEENPASVVQTGAALLHTALVIERRVARGEKLGSVLSALCEQNNGTPGLADNAQPTTEHPQVLLDAMASFDGAALLQEMHKALSVGELHLGMVLEQDITTNAGTCICKDGEQLTAAVIARLRAFAASVGINEPIHVRVSTTKGPAGRFS